MKQVIRDEALRALMRGESYRDAVATETVMEGLDSAPAIPLQVPIRFRKRYEDMTRDRPDSDSEGHEGTR